MQDLLSFIAACPTAYHAAAAAAAALDEAGYEALAEGAQWRLTPGRGYYVSRNGSSLIAFRLPRNAPAGFMIAAAHLDSPCFKLTETPEVTERGTVRLSVEKYGGGIFASWLDRPLSIAGRVLVRTGGGVQTRLVDLKEPCALIPNVAIHMRRDVNEKNTLNMASDMLLLYGPEGTPSLAGRIAQAAGAEVGDVLGSDLFVYNPQQGVVWNGLVSAPRLDDLQCAWSALTALLKAAPESSAVPVCCLFDNEEVGSQTQQGAASTFLRDVLERICGGSADLLRQLVASSFMASCDNAHALHPNHPELADARHAPRLGGGVVIKHNAAQRYTTDAVSDALFRLLCGRAGVAYQHYYNRADLPGGSTLGNIANTQVSLHTVDVGCAQLAMHSAFETAAMADAEAMTAVLTALFECALVCDGQGSFHLAP